MKIGFLLNPIAGLGGTVALKGTDGLAEKAIQLGAIPISPTRAEIFFTNLNKEIDTYSKVKLQFIVPPTPMGEQILSKSTFNYKTLSLDIKKNHTTAKDTITAIKLFEREHVDLIVFVGGDGTSVDVGMAITTKTPMLGIPSGVKTYGSVFAHSPEEAVTILLSFLSSQLTSQAELLDLDEQAYRKGIISITLKGIVTVPAFPQFFQHAKERIESSETEEANLERIAEDIAHLLNEKKGRKLIIIGPGSTFTPLSKILGINRSLLGVDCFEYSETGTIKTLISDAREDQIFNLLSKYKDIFLLLTPIGGMGYILGRGNHQISSRIVKSIPKEQFLICCTNRKLGTLKDGELRVDTPDTAFNKSQIGFVKVITDIDQRKMVRLVH